MHEKGTFGALFDLLGVCAMEWLNGYAPCPNLSKDLHCTCIIYAQIELLSTWISQRMRVSSLVIHRRERSQFK